jgi:hypothetical protein
LAMYLDFSNIQIADFKYAKIRPTSRWNMAALGRARFLCCRSP